MKLRTLTVFALISVALATVVANGTAQSAKVDTDNGSSQIQTLLKERRDTLHELVLAVKEQFRHGIGTHDAVIRASNQLLDAELELAQTREERIGIHKQRVRNLKELEEYARQRQRAAQVSVDKVLEARAARLGAEIELLREQARTN